MSQFALWDCGKTGESYCITSSRLLLVVCVVSGRCKDIRFFAVGVVEARSCSTVCVDVHAKPEGVDGGLQSLILSKFTHSKNGRRSCCWQQTTQSQLAFLCSTRLQSITAFRLLSILEVQKVSLSKK